MLCNNCCGLDDEVFQIKCAVWHIIHSYRSWFCCFYWLTVGGVTGRFIRVRTSLWEGKYAVGKQERAKRKSFLDRKDEQHEHGHAVFGIFWIHQMLACWHTGLLLKLWIVCIRVSDGGLVRWTMVQTVSYGNCIPVRWVRWIFWQMCWHLCLTVYRVRAGLELWTRNWKVKSLKLSIGCSNFRFLSDY